MRAPASAARDLPGSDALCKALGDGCLADSCSTDQSGAVIGLAAEDGEHMVYLTVAADNQADCLIAAGHVTGVAAQAQGSWAKLLHSSAPPPPAPQCPPLRRSSKGPSSGSLPPAPLNLSLLRRLPEQAVVAST
ncbi:hypothetical protein ZWY2020_001252 [Hordeum vulgare]|nr:hypothetical protein ZWY2020_001252 [Hordeum vulgare]